MAQQFTLAEAFVQFRAKGIGVLQRQMSGLKRTASGLVGLFGKLARAIKNAFTGKLAILGGLGIGAAGIGLLKLAADAEEMEAMFDQVFKETAKEAEQWSIDLARSLGRSRLNIKQFLAQAQATFVPTGFARKDALELSKVVVKLSLDLAAFNNIAEADAMQRLQSALVNNRIAMRALRVTITDARLAAELLKLGFKGTFAEASEMQKQLTILSLIMTQTADAQGQAARESGGLMGQWRRFTGVIKDLGATLGGILAPAAKEIMMVFTELAQIIEANRETFKKWGEAIGAAIRNVTGPMKLLIRGLAKDTQGTWQVITAGFSLGIAKLKVMVMDFVAWFMGVLDKVLDKVVARIIVKLKEAYPSMPFADETRGILAIAKGDAGRDVGRGFANIVGAMAGRKPVTEFDEPARQTSVKVVEAQKRFAEALEALRKKTQGGLAGPLAGGEKPGDLLQRLFDAAAGPAKAEKKKQGPQFEFSSFAGLWQQTQAKLGKEQDRLVKLAEKDAVVQNRILTAVEDIPLARWA